MKKLIVMKLVYHYFSVISFAEIISFSDTGILESVPFVELFPNMENLLSQRQVKVFFPQ